MGLLVAGFERAHVLGFKVGIVPDLRTCSDDARRTNWHHRVRLYDGWSGAEFEGPDLHRFGAHLKVVKTCLP